MDEVYCQKVIICTKKRRGNGKDIPIRIVKEVFNEEGLLIAEADPLNYSVEKILDFVYDHKEDIKNDSSKIMLADLIHKYLNK